MHYLVARKLSVRKAEERGNGDENTFYCRVGYCRFAPDALAGLSQSDQSTSAVPPVAQPLVREGDFAIGLVKVLEIGIPQKEADAESMLDSAGIAPRNGWRITL